jgi:hypothetical protein
VGITPKRKVKKVLTGEKAKSTVSSILNRASDYGGDYPGPRVSGYYREGKGWTAFDNTTGNCWVEDFKTEKSAREFARKLDTPHDVIHKKDIKRANRRKRRMYDYEITLKYIGKGKRPQYTHDEYGFDPNPPIGVRAMNKKNALKQLKLPKTVKVVRVERFKVLTRKDFRKKKGR